MDHNDHVNLIRRGVEGAGSRWADLGAGGGAFTLALADILGQGSDIIAIDRDAGALKRNATEMEKRFPGARVKYRTGDFTAPLEALTNLDGIVMANSLHFQHNQAELVRRIRGYLRPGGRLVIVEYNVQRGNFAVPHP
ncbi:MAG TPA: class I SAM-dependent methyltransferase, partial [Tepidiformaceae bacterium]|nr:class I SAM-dependent methyltransferase [Tepidiformaceae bacterium]